MYCTAACGGHCSPLPLFSTKELVDFLLFYFIFGCLVNFLHLMDFSRANCVQAATRLSAPISGVPALLSSEEFI